MTKLLSNEEVGLLTVYQGLHHVETPLLAEFIRHIEAAILAEQGKLEAQGKQEPVAIHQWQKRGSNIWHDSTKDEAYARIDEHYEGRTLYAAPITANANVQPDMVMVPREPTLAMLDCLRADTTPNLGKRYSAMIAAAEKEAGK